MAAILLSCRAIVLHPMNRLEKENIAEINSHMRNTSQHSGLSDYGNCQFKQETAANLFFLLFFPIGLDLDLLTTGWKTTFWIFYERFSTGGSQPISGLQSCIDRVVALWAIFFYFFKGF